MYRDQMGNFLLLSEYVCNRKCALCAWTTVVWKSILPYSHQLNARLKSCIRNSFSIKFVSRMVYWCVSFVFTRFPLTYWTYTICIEWVNGWMDVLCGKTQKLSYHTWRNSHLTHSNFAYVTINIPFRCYILRTAKIEYFLCTILRSCIMKPRPKWWHFIAIWVPPSVWM